MRHHLRFIATLFGILAGLAAPQEIAAQPLRDLFGDPLPPGAIARCGTVRMQIGDEEPIALSPDGSKLAHAVGEEGNEVEIWDIATGKRLATHTRHGAKSPIATLTYSHDGSRILAIGDGISMLSLADRKWQFTIPGPPRKQDPFGHSAPLVALSQDGGLLAVTYDRQNIELRDGRTGKELKRLETPKIRGRWSIFDWDPPFQKATIGAFGFLGDSHTLAVLGSAEQLFRWDTEKDQTEVKRGGDTIARYYGVQSDQLAISPDGKLAVVPTLRRIRVLDFESGSVVREIERKGLGPLGFDKTGKSLVAISDDRAVCSIDLASGERRELFELPESSKKPVVSMEISRNGKTMAARSRGNRVLVWDVENKSLFPYCAGDEYIFSVAFSPDSKRLGTSGWRRVGMWNADDGRPLWSAEPDRRLLFLSDGSQALTLQDGRVISIRDAASGRVTQRFLFQSWNPEPPPFLSPYSTHIHRFIDKLMPLPDGESLLAFTHQDAVLWNSKRNDYSYGVVGSPRMSLTKDGKTYVMPEVHANPRFALWTFDAKTGEVKQGLKSVGEAIDSPVISPDGKLVAAYTLQPEYWVSRDRKPVMLYVWDAVSGEIVARVADQRLWNSAHTVLREESETYHVNSLLAFSPDGRVLALAGGDGSIILYESRTGRTIEKFEGHRGLVTSLSFSPDGMRLASSGTDTTVLVWTIPK